MESKGKTSNEIVATVTIDTSWTRKEPVDSPYGLEQEKKRLGLEYGHLFGDTEEFDLFCMLPVNDQQRKTLVSRMRTVAPLPVCQIEQ